MTTKHLPKILKKVAEILNQNVGERGFIAILDKYTLGIALTIVEAEKTKSAIHHIIASLARVVQIQQLSMHIDCKAGVANNQSDVSVNQLVNNALHAVTVNDALINYYETGSHQRFIEHQEISILLNEALTNEELYVDYQPKVRGDGTLIGMEALLRWNSPVIGRVSPGVFIPIAEQSGLATMSALR